MLAAHRDIARFRGKSEGEFLCWLRQILSNRISHAVDAHVLAKKRDVRREVALDQVGQSFDDSVGTLSQIIPASLPTPSEECRRREVAVQLSNELAKLKPDYRDVIIYRNLQGLAFEEIAERMDRKCATVRMMWLRAIEKFKSVCEPIE